MLDKLDSILYNVLTLGPPPLPVLTKLFVAGGLVSGNDNIANAEVIDLSGEGRPCQDPYPLPQPNSGKTCEIWPLSSL